MYFPTLDALLADEFEDAAGLHGRAPRFVRLISEAGGTSLGAEYVSDGYLPGDLPLRALNTFE